MASVKELLTKTATLVAMPERRIIRPSLKRTDIMFAIPETAARPSLNDTMSLPAMPETDVLPGSGISVGGTEPASGIFSGSHSVALPSNVTDVRSKLSRLMVVNHPGGHNVLMRFENGKGLSLPVPDDSIIKIPAFAHVPFSVEGAAGLASAISGFCKGNTIYRVMIFPSGTPGYNSLHISTDHGDMLAMVSPPPAHNIAIIDLPRSLMAGCLSCRYDGDAIKLGLDDGRIVLMRMQSSPRDMAVSSTSLLFRNIIPKNLPSKKVDSIHTLGIEIENLCKGKTILSIQSEDISGKTCIFIRLEDKALSYSTVVVDIDTKMSFSLASSG